MTTPLPRIDGVDFAVLNRWMNEQDLPPGTIHNVKQLTGGTQNILVRFNRGDRAYVLRRPPLHKRRGSDEIMRREARILAALASTAVAHPRLIAACEDIEPMGAAFYLMEPVEGANPVTDLPDAYRADASWRRTLGLAMAEGAAAIGAVDHLGVGLADLGRPDGFLERQVGRWRRELDGYQELDGYDGPHIPGISEVARWLEANLPTGSQPGLMHGDFHVGNVMVSFDRPGLAGIVDWEMATIGDPLMDLGGALAYWIEAGDGRFLRAMRRQPSDAPGMLTRAEIVARYGERTGLDPGDWAFYEVFGLFRLATILQQIYYRYHRRQTRNPAFRHFWLMVNYLDRRCCTRIRAAG